MPKARTTRSSSTVKAKKAPARKVIAKKATAPRCASTKRSVSKAKPAGKAIKKQAVAPKKTAMTREDRAGAKTLDLCLILDCTGSMGSWI